LYYYSYRIQVFTPIAKQVYKTKQLKLETLPSQQLRSSLRASTMDGAGEPAYDPGPPPIRKAFPIGDGGAGKALFLSAKTAWYTARTGNELTGATQYKGEVAKYHRDAKRQRTQGAAAAVPVAVPLRASPRAGVTTHFTGIGCVPGEGRTVRTWADHDSEFGLRRTNAGGFMIVTKIPGHPEREREREKATQEEQVR